MNMRAAMHDSPDALLRLQWLQLIFFVVAMITGAVGGCVGFVHSGRQTKEIALALLVGYLICGAFGAVMVLAGAWVFTPWLVDSLPKLILLSGAAGFLTSMSLAGANLTMRLILRKLGVEVVIDLKRTEKAGAAQHD